MSWYIKNLTTVDPELDEPFLPTEENIHLFRKRWSAGSERFARSLVVQRALAAGGPRNWSEKDIKIPVRDGSKIDARVYCPNQRPEDGSPAMVVFHGGGWCLGGVDTEEVQCQLWCQRLGVVVINVAYRLAPEFKFPIPPLDAYDSVRWVAANAGTLTADLEKGFIVAGFSGGAMFASAASHLARDDKLQPPITGVFLSAPILVDAVEDGTGKMFPIRELAKTFEINKNAPLQNQAMSDRFRDLSHPRQDSPLTSPFLFPSHKDLPPAYIQALGLDPFCDSAFIYEGLLRTAGSPTKIDCYLGVPHGFWAAFPMLTATRKWIEDIVTGAAWLLEQGQQRQIKSKL